MKKTLWVLAFIGVGAISYKLYKDAKAKKVEVKQ